MNKQISMFKIKETQFQQSGDYFQYLKWQPHSQSIFCLLTKIRNLSIFLDLHHLNWHILATFQEHVRQMSVSPMFQGSQVGHKQHFSKWIFGQLGSLLYLMYTCIQFFQCQYRCILSLIYSIRNMQQMKLAFSFLLEDFRNVEVD